MRREGTAEHPDLYGRSTTLQKGFLCALASLRLILKKYPGTVPAFCVILGNLLRIAPKFSGCLAVPSRLPPLASGLLPIRPPQRGKMRLPRAQRSAALGTLARRGHWIARTRRSVRPKFWRFSRTLSET